MKENFAEKTEKLGKKLGKEEIILASLIEREVKLDKDRPVVGGILLKRLENDWPLEVDAAVQYALASRKCQPIATSYKPTPEGGQTQASCWWPKVTGADLEMESEYNSYKNRGLPPTPICNPGLASIKAAIFPQKSEYWFYLSDKKGEMHYAKTLEEHEENIEKYLNR